LAPGGGCAISIRPATTEESSNPKKYNLGVYPLNKNKRSR
jgi:hypothetical protein